MTAKRDPDRALSLAKRFLRRVICARLSLYHSA